MGTTCVPFGVAEVKPPDSIAYAALTVACEH